MIFLSPATAVIAGALAIPALLTLYFLKLRRRPVRVSSILLWKQAVRDLQVNVPFRWIRPSLMLLLHLAVLALFLAAMARPAINMDAAPPAKIVLLIDRSASMGSVDAGAGAGGGGIVSRLESAKERALRTIEGLSRSGRNSAISIVAFAGEPRALTTFSIDHGALRSAVGSIEASDQPADLGAALRLASAMLTGEADEEGRQERGLVVLFSDGSHPDDGALALAGADFRFERTGPASTVDGAPLGSAGVNNLGIVALAARRDWEDPGVVRVFARVASAMRTPIAVPVTLSLDGREVQRKAVSIPPHEPAAAPPEDVGASVAPLDTGEGSASVTFELPMREAGVISVAIDRADVLAADNTASAVLDAAVKPRVLLVTPEPGAGEPDLSWIYTRIFEELRLPYRRVPASAFAEDLRSGSPLSAELVVLDRVRVESLPAAPTLSFGGSHPHPAVEIGPEQDSGTYVLAWDRMHPLLRYVAMDSVYISRATPIRIADTAAADVLARGGGGPLMVLLDGGGVRRLLVAFSPVNSTWPRHTSFPVFIASAIDYLTLSGSDRAATSFTTTEPVRLTLAGPGRLMVDGPLTRSIDVEPQTQEGPIVVSLGILEQSGVYRISGSAPGAPEALAVNLLDERETRAQVAETIRVAGRSVSGLAGESGPREVWHWFVAGALALLVLEWFLSAWMLRA